MVPNASVPLPYIPSSKYFARGGDQYLGNGMSEQTSDNSIQFRNIDAVARVRSVQHVHVFPSRTWHVLTSYHERNLLSRAGQPNITTIPQASS